MEQSIILDRICRIMQHNAELINAHMNPDSEHTLNNIGLSIRDTINDYVMENAESTNMAEYMAGISHLLMLLEVKLEMGDKVALDAMMNICLKMIRGE